MSDIHAAYNNSGKYAFVSYSHKDSVHVLGIIHALQEMGYNIWYDEGIPLIEKYDEILVRKIENCSVFILFVSKHSTVSPEVDKEVHLAIKRNIPVLRINLDNSPLPASWIFHGLEEQQFISVNSDPEVFFRKVGETLRDCRDDAAPADQLSIPKQAVQSLKKLKKKTGPWIIAAVLAVLACTALAFLLPKPDTPYYDPGRAYSAGDTFLFGEYEQDNELSNGNEEIEWRVLHVEDDRVLAVSEKILDAMPYDSNDSKGSIWEGCDLRKWLNGSFYNNAFSAKDKELVISASNPGYKNPEYPDVASSTTTDNVFCLSIYEVETYMKNRYITLLAEPTPFAKAKIVSADSSTMPPAQPITDPDANRPWWLRTNGWDTWLGAIIHEEDRIAYRGRLVTAEDIGVRPAIFLEHN